MKFFLGHYKFVLFLYIGVCWCIKASAQQAHMRHYTKREVMVPMRDGIKLFTRIYLPDSINDPLPVLLMRSPYGDWNMGLKSPEKDCYVANMAEDGYIFVYQNIRGKQKSEGEFIMEGPIHKYDPNEINEATDTYDLIEWLLKNLNTNGRVGQLGISFPGELAILSCVKPHPALKAVSPQGTVADFFLGDDYFHNGAFRLSFGFEYTYGEEFAKGDTSFNFGQFDLFNWYLQLGPLTNVNKTYFKGQIPSWNDFTAHPNYDAYWKNKAPVNFVDTPLIPILHVGGLWDQENLNGPEALYAKMEQYDTKNYNFIVLGPWCHGQWSDSEATVIGDYTIGSNTAPYFRDIQKTWFDYWLKGIGTGDFPEAICFQTGSNCWKTYSSWPCKDVNIEKIYLGDDKKLSFEKPAGKTQGADSYFSDPANPVVYRPRPIQLTYSDSSDWDTWLTNDQRFVDGRPDVVAYQSDTLTADLTITGEVFANIFAATTGSDADWVVKLIDVYPNMYGSNLNLSQYELMVASDIFRGRFRNSFSEPEAITPNKVENYRFSLHQVNHTFKKGHRIGVQIQSSWFPIFDRNPQKFVPNIFLAKPSDFIQAVQTIYRTKEFPSSIELPIIPSSNQ
jgi:uncharacterized protein